MKKLRKKLNKKINSDSTSHLDSESSVIEIKNKRRNNIKIFQKSNK